MRLFAAPILAAGAAALAASAPPDGLRGQQAPPAPPPVVSTASTVRFITVPLDPDLSVAPRIGGLASPGGGARCRSACANDHYMCLVDRDQDVCAGAWSQCVSACPATSSASF
jgi:hypothetical protein